MKEIYAGPAEPTVPEVPPFELTEEMQTQSIKTSRTYNLELTVKKTATRVRKTIALDSNTNLNLTIVFKK